jgi:DNA repair protein RadC
MAQNNDEKKVNIHKGHREKVKQRYYEAGLTSMPDHNILELLLFFGIPQKDTNPLAHELIETFGSFSGVLEASKTELQSVKGMTENAACLLSLILPVYKRYVKDLHKKKRKFEDAKEMADYLRPFYLDTPNERIYAMCFDLHDRMIACRVVSDGDRGSASLDCCKLASIALEVKAKKIVLSHNHPNGTLRPSEDDVEATEMARDMLMYLKVQLKDHIIITDKSYFSMVNSPSFIHVIYGGDPLVNK